MRQKGIMTMTDVFKTPRKAGARVKPAPRRLSETRKLSWTPPNNPDAAQTTIFVTISFDASGLRPLDIFYDSGYRSGSDLEALVSDICIIMSVFLQHEDIDLATFTKSVSTGMDHRFGTERAASIVGVLLDELQKPPLWADALCVTAKGDGDA